MKLIALACALILSVSLFVNITLLRSRGAGITLDPTFALGSRLPVVKGHYLLDPAQAVLSLNMDTVIYVFSAACGWCRRDYANLSALDSQLSARGYSLVLVTLDPESDALRAYLAKHPVRRKVFVVDSTSVVPELARKLKATPQVIVLSPLGLIKRHWVGALFDTKQAEVEAFFKVTLPGLTVRKESRTGGV
jgi:hypothetical protein